MTEIVIDTETTGFPNPDATPLIKQPYITEIFAYKIDKESLQVIDEFQRLFKVPIPLDEVVVKITGITDEMLSDQGTFAESILTFSEFCCGASCWVAHNCNFDMTMIRLELQRIAKEFLFPWPYEEFCTVNNSLHIEGHRLKLNELYKIATGKEHKGAHRARADVDALLACYQYLKSLPKLNETIEMLLDD